MKALFYYSVAWIFNFILFVSFLLAVMSYYGFWTGLYFSSPPVVGVRRPASRELPVLCYMEMRPAGPPALCLKCTQLLFHFVSRECYLSFGEIRISYYLEQIGIIYCWQLYYTSKLMFIYYSIWLHLNFRYYRVAFVIEIYSITPFPFPFYFTGEIRLFLEFQLLRPFLVPTVIPNYCFSSSSFAFSNL